jgi:transcription initiation factor TFIID subunit 10
MSDSTAQPPDTKMETDNELDPTVEDEINHDATQADAMNLDGANDAEPAPVNGMADTTTAFEARIPAKKDATLREFLGKMDEYAPIVCGKLASSKAVTLLTKTCRYQMQ